MKDMRGRYTAAIAGCMVALLMTACGGGGGGTTSGTATSTATLTGSAGDGPIVGGTVTVTDANGNTIGTATTDANAHYSIKVPSTAALPLTVTITGGTDQVTGAAPDFPLKSAVTTSLSTVSNNTVNANPLTTIAVDTAQALAGSGNKISTADLNAAIANVRNTLGFGTDTTFNPISGTVSASNVASTVKANEAVAELIRRTTASSGDSISNVITALAQDLTDGSVDGKAKAGATSTLVSASLAAQAQANVVSVSAQLMTNSLAITNTSGTVVKTAAAALTSLDNAATLSNGGTAPTTTVANVPVNATFIQQAKAAVAAAKSLASATGKTTTQLTAFETALGNITAGTKASAVSLSGVTLSSLDTEASATATAAKTATATQLATANAQATALLNFKLSSDTLSVQDYNASNAALTPFTVTGTVASGVMTANFGYNTLNSGNLSNLAQSSPTGTAPKVSMTLANIPPGNGTATITALLKDGTSATRSANERMLRVVFDVDWSSDGSTLTLTAAAGNATATYYTKAGTAAVTATLTNKKANVLSTGTSVSVPAGATQIKAAIGNLFTSSGLGTALNGVQVIGNYYYQIDFSGFPLIDSANASFSTLEGTFLVR